MCLYSAKKVTPEEDILVYKALRIRKRSVNLLNIKEYCSPYHRDTTWYLHERKDIDAPEPELEYQITPFEGECFKVQGNAFHSFNEKMKAIDEAEYLACMHEEPIDNYVVGKFIIPKDSKYVFVGKYSGGISYASSSLIFNGIVNMI